MKYTIFYSRKDIIMTEACELKTEKNEQDKEPQIETEHLTTKFFNDLMKNNRDIEIIFRDRRRDEGLFKWFDRWNIKLSISDDKECLIYRQAY
jgi:sRNA-binding regulator protein Hfq